MSHLAGAGPIVSGGLRGLISQQCRTEGFKGSECPTWLVPGQYTISQQYRTEGFKGSECPTWLVLPPTRKALVVSTARLTENQEVSSGGT